MASDLEKAARRVVDHPHLERMVSPGFYEKINALRAALPGEGEVDMPPETASEQISRLADFIMSEIDGEPSRSEGAVDCAIRLLRDKEPQPAPPAVTRGEVVTFIAEHEESAGWGTVVRMLRSWLALEERVREVEKQRDDFHDEVALLRAVADAAEACHRACPDPSQCVLCDARRRLKEGE